MAIVGIIGDTHLPFTHPRYLRFCADTFNLFGCDRIVHIGDLFDFHAISYHESDPEGMGPGHEYAASKKALIPWTKEFPEVDWCLGNHDKLPKRKMMSAGLPTCFLKGYHELWDLPVGWKVDLGFNIDGVRYEHGTKNGGMYGHKNAAMKKRTSFVMGHSHSYAGVNWMASEDDIIFGLNAGCGIDVRAYAMEYGSEFAQRPTLGCGIVIDGKEAFFVPMDFTNKKYQR